MNMVTKSTDTGLLRRRLIVFCGVIIGAGLFSLTVGCTNPVSPVTTSRDGGVGDNSSSSSSSESSGPDMSGSGTLSVAVTWPVPEHVKAIDLRLRGDGVLEESWITVDTDSFVLQDDSYAVNIEVGEIAAGTYDAEVRFDAGPLTEQRYRAEISRSVTVRPDTATTVTVALERSDFLDYVPPPGSWEGMDRAGDISIAPDGAVTFTAGAYDAPRGGGSISVGDSGEITFADSGERRLRMTTPAVSSARFELDGAAMTTGNGWGIFVHGVFDGNGYSGYTIQFDPGLGDLIVIRQWNNNTEYTPFLTYDAASHGVDLRSPMDIRLHLDGNALRLELRHPGSEWTGIFDVPDIAEIANAPADARSEGVLGFRGWSSTDLSVEQVRLYVFD